jgi:hypothetical protein
MKLKEFDLHNSRKIPRAGRPFLRVTRRAGTLFFSASTAQTADLKEGDGVVLFQDEENPADWYFKKNNSPKSFILRKATNKAKGLVFNNSALAGILLDSAQTTGNLSNCTFGIQKNTVDIDGVHYYLIITADLLNPVFKKA